ncbi:hypothetical protein [Nocardia terpenica]|uniref:hypothetical protein n=1 Tax=Nocardia terpenica TaxID=455432 RepID=UPI0012FE56D6|nr:hypothetical protein [Nocardia terpenica]
MPAVRLLLSIALLTMLAIRLAATGIRALARLLPILMTLVRTVVIELRSYH